MSASPIVSVVFPIYNERENIAILVTRIGAVLERATGGQFEVVFVDPQSLPNFAPIRDKVSGVADVIGVAGAGEAWVTPYEALIAKGSRHFSGVATACTDPAILVYTSGTTGQPKGALIPQQCLLGNLPGVKKSSW